LTTTRTAGKYGRRPPKRSPALQLRDYLTGAIPAAPVYQDYLATLSGWQMLGNDVAGDCVAVTWANTRRLVSTTLGTANYPTQAQTWLFYETQNPGFSPSGNANTDGPGSQDDNGMDIQTGLEDLVANGGPDGVKAVGFASVDYTNPAEVNAAIDIFGSVWTGINVLDINQTEFSGNQPWNYSATSTVEGGHSIIVGGFGDIAADTGALAGDRKFITWAAETSFTDAFWQNEVEECWAVIWPEHLGSREFVAGMNLQAFATDFTAITGQPFPAAVPPSPAPAPAPAPPAPVPAANPDVALWDVGQPWCADVRTRPDLVQLKAALLTWAAAKNFPA
jgi:hypothetical protein